MRSQHRPLQNQSGQLVVEAVLLLALLVGISMLVTSRLKRSNFAQNLVTSPWEKMSGMVECGNWGKCAAGFHPSSINRIVSWLPEDQL
jgi:hypothetical protein